MGEFLKCVHFNDPLNDPVDPNNFYAASLASSSCHDIQFWSHYNSKHLVTYLVCVFSRDLDTFMYFNHFLNGLNRSLACQNKSIIILEVFKCLPELILVNKLKSKSRCTIRSESFVFQLLIQFKKERKETFLTTHYSRGNNKLKHLSSKCKVVLCLHIHCKQLLCHN